jgi:hypothetical protein
MSRGELAYLVLIAGAVFAFKPMLPWRSGRNA